MANVELVAKVLMCFPDRYTITEEELDELNNVLDKIEIRNKKRLMPTLKTEDK